MVADSNQSSPISPTAQRYTHGYCPPVVKSMAGRSAESHARFLLHHLRPGLRLLDVGCGPGTITVDLAQAVAPGEAIGLDVEPTMATAGEALARERGLQNLRFDAGHAETLPYPDASFDIVFEHTLLEHVSDPLAVIREMRRVLRPGGLVALRDGDWGSNVLIPEIGPDLQKAVALYERWWHHRGGDPKFGRRQRPLLRAAGFTRLETTAGTNAIPAPGEAFATRISATDFVGEVVALGWIERGAPERWAEGFRIWNQHPDALFANLLFETVAWVE